MFVSAIMPTTSARREFIPAAVKCFQAQTWKEKELIVVDDGPLSVWDLVANVPGVVYLRYPERMTIGRKRNIACEHAAGEVIVHWDDDDWSAPERIADQVGRLRQSGKAVTGYHSLAFWNAATRELTKYHGESDYSCGSCLCYRKDFWEANRFHDVAKGEDSNFVDRARAVGQVAAVDAGQLMLASIHPGNTAERQSWPALPLSELPPAFATLTTKQA